MYSLCDYWFRYENKKKNYPQGYLEECKYKTKMFKFINTELESESELEFDTELESKLELVSDSE